MKMKRTTININQRRSYEKEIRLVINKQNYRRKGNGETYVRVPRMDVDTNRTLDTYI
jgi:hypothetical protein